jgi:hypothetical protein
LIRIYRFFSWICKFCGNIGRNIAQNLSNSDQKSRNRSKNSPLAECGIQHKDTKNEPVIKKQDKQDRKRQDKQDGHIRDAHLAYPAYPVFLLQVHFLY